MGALDIRANRVEFSIGPTKMNHKVTAAMLLLAVVILASVTIVGQKTASSLKAVQQPLRVSNIKDTSVVDGCGCYFQFPSEWEKKAFDKNVFMQSIDGTAAWMNIDGKDVRLMPDGPGKGSGEKVGSRSSEKYKATGISVLIDFVVTRVCDPDDESCESTSYDATFTVTKAGRKRVVKAKGLCGC